MFGFKRKDKSGVDKAFKGIMDIVDSRVLNSLRKKCEQTMRIIEENKEFLGFTGNTQLSYMGGLYYNGSLIDVIHQGKWVAPPRRRKLRLGEAAYLENPYEGRERLGIGAVEVGEDYGTQTSMNFLRKYKAPKKGFAFVFTTGTEYSLFLETERGLNVLTGAYVESQPLLEAIAKEKLF